MEPKVNTSVGNETASETVARIQAARANAGDSKGGDTTTSGGNSALIDALTARLTEQGQGISTSSSSNLQSSINDAISSTQEAGALTTERLQSERGREIGFAQDRASAQFTGALEERTGYSTQVVAFRELTETTEKSIRDLDKRYTEAILANDSATATRVADLQMEKLEFLERQEQSFYTNMFALAQLDLTQSGQEAEQTRFESGQAFDIDMFERGTARDERNQVMGLAAEYGVEVSPNESLESMIAKVSPFVDEQRRLELQQLSSSINANNATAARALREGNKDLPLDDVMIDAFALAYINGEKDLVKLETTEQAGQVYARVTEIRAENEAELTSLADAASSEEDFIEAARISGSPFQQADVDRYVEIYGSAWHDKQRDIRRSGTSYSDALVIDELTGRETTSDGIVR